MGKCILAGHTTGDTGGLRISTGSYVGTGTASVTLTFPFTPKVLIVSHRQRAGYFASVQTGVASTDNYGGNGFIVLYGTSYYIIGQSETRGSEKRIDFAWDNKTVSWTGYPANSAWTANYPNNDYDWLIIG